MIHPGSSTPLGAFVTDGGVNFAVFAPAASRIELCLFDHAEREFRRYDLPEQSGGVWYGFVPGLGSGQLYGYRAHGNYAAESGRRFNAQKLLLDPYTRALAGSLRWCDAVFDFDRGQVAEKLVPNQLDSAPFVPKSVVLQQGLRAVQHRRIPWDRTLLYELNVRGFTIGHPALAEIDRGRFSGLHSAPIISHLRALGVTSVELMPVHAFADEEFLVQRGLRNYWGYNSLAFFAAEPRYLGEQGLAGLTAAVDGLHDAGIEVILDVVYNHTAEGGRLGPTLSFRGLANDIYYRLQPGAAEDYVNDTGCGNTINTDEPMVRQLIVDSLSYWASEIGVDGFRFDLATVLARSARGFDPGHPLFAEIDARQELRDAKFIAEPWDVGPGGYQLGGFPPGWGEWNDRFRDTVRSFWRGDPGLAPEFARRVHGSADLFESGGRGPDASVSFVASHDGFTTADLVSFSQRHNEANGERNRDGHSHNFSCNHGVEGASVEPTIVAVRRRHRLNLLATVLTSQGVPMLLAGDEFGNSQAGNNNAYAQDNAVGWLDWAGLDRDPEFLADIVELSHLRRELGLLRQTSYRHGDPCRSTGHRDIEWFGPDGAQIPADLWSSTRVFGLLLSRPDDYADTEADIAVSVIYNVADVASDFVLPLIQQAGEWSCRYCSAGPGAALPANGRIRVPEFSLVLLEYAPNDSQAFV